MLHLRTFGGLSVEAAGPSTRGAAQQRKTLALLALLAAADRRGMSRDRLIAYLWPGADTEHARNLLNQACYALRRDLHAPELFLGATELRLNPAVFTSDIQTFEHAVEGGDPQRAAAVYMGSFLDGFYLGEAGEFERWVEGERSRLARRAIETLELLATRATSAGDVKAALKWWRRLTELDPLSAQAALGLMRALDDAGERVEAVQHGRHYEAYVRQELGVEPPAEVLALTQELHHQTGEGVRRAPERAVVVEPPSVEPARGPLRSARLGWRLALAAAAIVLVGGMVVVARVWTHAVSDAESTGLAVLPFRVVGTERTLWREGMMHLLSANLDGTAGLRQIDPRTILSRWRTTIGEGADAADPSDALRVAQAVGATYAVLGSAVAIGGTVRLAAQVHDLRTHRLVGTAVVQGAPDSVFALVDRLSVEVLRSGLISESAERPPVDIRRITTASLPALKAYLRGEVVHRRGRYHDATELFRQAIEADSTFALAYERLAMSLPFWDAIDVATAAVNQALRYSARLTSRERRLLNAFSLYLGGHADDAERLYRVALAEGSEDADAWFQLGGVFMMYNPLRGRPSSDGRQAFLQATALQPEHWHSRLALSYLAALNEDHAESDRWLAGMPLQHEYALYPQTVAAFRSDDAAAQERQWALFRTAPPEVVLSGARYVAVLARNLDGAERITRWLTVPSREPEIQAIGYSALAHLALAAGRLRAARAALDSAGTRDAGLALVYRALFAALPFLPADTAAIADLEGELVRWDPRDSIQSMIPTPSLSVPGELRPALRLYLLGLLSARRGNVAAADRYTGELTRLERPASSGELIADLAKSVRAHAAWKRRQTTVALQLLDATDRHATVPQFVYSPFYSEALERFTRAELLREHGRELNALEWYGSLDEYSVYDVTYAAPAYLRRAEIYERQGERVSARREYARFLRFWSECDPELRPTWEKGRQALARLGGILAP